MFGVVIIESVISNNSVICIPENLRHSSLYCWPFTSLEAFVIESLIIRGSLISEVIDSLNIWWDAVAVRNS